MGSRAQIALFVLLTVLFSTTVPSPALRVSDAVLLEARGVAVSDAALHDPAGGLDTFVASARWARARLTRGTADLLSRPRTAGGLSQARVAPPRFLFRRPAPRAADSDAAGPH